MEEINEEGAISRGMYLIGPNGTRKVTSIAELTPRERWLIGVSLDVAKTTVTEVVTEPEVENDDTSAGGDL
jgi:hypothetical protein